jgi:hypothetical protein
MDEEMRDIRETVEDNNRILRKLLAHQRYSTMISVFKWALIIGTALGAYYFLQPFIDQLLATYQALNGTFGPQNFLNFGSSSVTP